MPVARDIILEPGETRAKAGKSERGYASAVASGAGRGRRSEQHGTARGMDFRTPLPFLEGDPAIADFEHLGKVSWCGVYEGPAPGSGIRMAYAHGTIQGTSIEKKAHR